MDEWEGLRRSEFNNTFHNINQSQSLTHSLALSFPLSLFTHSLPLYPLHPPLTWNRRHFANEWVDESSADGRSDISDRESESRGHTNEFGVMRKTQMSLGDTNREIREALGRGKRGKEM
jgi:hypothetical protein